MKDILKHELYKIFSRKSIYLALILFIALYVFFTYGDITRTKDNMTPEEYYSKIEGPITQKKINWAEEVRIMIDNDKDGKYKEKVVAEDGTEYYNLTNEGSTLSGLSEEVAYTNGLRQDLKENINQSSKNIKKLKEKGEEGYTYRREKLQYNMLKSLDEPSIYYSEAWKKIIDFINVLGLVFVGGMILLGISPVFSDEYASNMDSLILSTKNGKKKVVTAKILAAIIYIIAISSIFALINMMVSITAFGVKGWNEPIQNIYKYIFSPYSFQAYQYHIVQLLFQIGGGVGLGLLTLAISVVSRHAIIPFFIGGGIFVLPEMAKAFLGNEKSVVRTLLDFSYTTVMKVEALFMNFKSFNMLGFPVLYPITAIAVMLILSLISIIFIYNAFKRHQVTG